MGQWSTWETNPNKTPWGTPQLGFHSLTIATTSWSFALQALAFCIAHSVYAFPLSHPILVQGGGGGWWTSEAREGRGLERGGPCQPRLGRGWCVISSACNMIRPRASVAHLKITISCYGMRLSLGNWLTIFHSCDLWVGGIRCVGVIWFVLNVPQLLPIRFTKETRVALADLRWAD